MYWRQIPRRREFRLSRNAGSHVISIGLGTCHTFPLSVKGGGKTVPCVALAMVGSDSHKILSAVASSSCCDQEPRLKGALLQCSCQKPSSTEPRGSRHLVTKELGLQDHDYYGFWGRSPS